jgi:NADH-quinone oxidoreductase subunit J
LYIVIFAILAVLSIAGAILVITFRSPVSSALALIFVLCCIAGLFALVGALFIAALQVIVYAGAIMVLFLFIIMLLNLKEELISKDEKKLTRILGTVLGIVFLFEIGYLTISSRSALYQPIPAHLSSIELTAERLFVKYLFPFEVTSVLLLVAIVGAIMLAQTKRKTERQ